MTGTAAAQLRRVLDALPATDDTADRAARRRVEGAILALAIAEGSHRAARSEAAHVLTGVMTAIRRGELTARPEVADALEGAAAALAARPA